ncbi:MAG: hypothetical protein WKF75_06900 [Singulisphaera sp.]
MKIGSSEALGGLGTAEAHPGQATLSPPDGRGQGRRRHVFDFDLTRK